MSDRRQRARVQGSWAPSRPKPAPRPAGGAEGFVRSAAAPSAHSSSWGDGGQAFEFHQPAKPLRDVPAEKVIEKAGEYEISHGPSGVSRLRLLPGFLSQTEADWLFSKLLAELPWAQKTNFKHGQAYEEPRLTCWYGELPYTYSNSTLQPNSQWPAVLADLKAMVEQVSGSCFNSLLCNLYRDGKDSIAWHSDSELSLGPHPAIASLSLGDTRCFSMRKQPRPVSYTLTTRSLHAHYTQTTHTLHTHYTPTTLTTHTTHSLHTDHTHPTHSLHSLLTNYTLTHAHTLATHSHTTHKLHTHYILTTHTRTNTTTHTHTHTFTFCVCKHIQTQK